MLSWCKWLLVCNDVPGGVFGVLHYYRIMFKGGSRLFICWLMMELAIRSNKELRCMLMHIIRVGFEGLNLPRMAYIISC